MKVGFASLVGLPPISLQELVAWAAANGLQGMEVNIGPGYQHAERCVSRVVNNNFSSLLTPAAVATSLNHDTYEEAWRDIYANPHFWGHGALLLMVSYPTQSLHATLLRLR